MTRNFPKHKRRRSDHQGIDDWLMTYADMITLLLCFFAIFLSISVPKEEQMEKARRQVAEHFANPDMLAGKSVSQRQTFYDGMPSIVDGSGNVVDDIDRKMKLEIVDQIDIKGTRMKLEWKGDRIKRVDIPSVAFFASGSAELRQEGKSILRDIMSEKLMSPEFKDYQITIEGHTDDVPINTPQFPSNWELSAARAAAVVRYLIESGVDPARLNASGYADTFPKAPNRDASGRPDAAGRTQNRRVVIRLEKVERSEDIR